nr:RNA polymerase sigma factor region1.1 domain-containing protein [Nitrospina gracilis]
MSNADKVADVSEINQLISLGKEKGYLTYEEVNDVLPSHLVAPDQIDDLMHLFGENEIDIVDSAMKEDKNTDEEDESEKEEAVVEETITDTKTDTVSIDDPVRMYLREMGTISLLTREGEVEIAKRIEDGQNEVLSAVANCSVTIYEIVCLGESIKEGLINVFEVINQGEPDEKKEIDEKEEIKRLQKAIRNLLTQEKKVFRLRERCETKLSEKMREKVEKELDEQQKKLEDMVLDLNLNSDVMDGIIERIYEIAARFREAGKQERMIEKELGMSLAEVKNWPRTGPSRKASSCRPTRWSPARSTTST